MASLVLRFGEVERDAESECGRGGETAGAGYLCAHYGLTGQVVGGVCPPHGVHHLTWSATHGEVYAAISARWQA